MLQSPPAPSPDQLAQIEALLAQSAAQDRARAESFERCDIDGFVSQWAHGINADKARMEVQILRNGGYAQFWVLLDADDNVIADRMHWFQNQYSFAWQGKWRLGDDDAAKYGRRWVPVGDNSRVQKQLGLREEKRWFPAFAKIVAEGNGLSGAASARVEAVRKFEENA
jgi:hypothetical protein